MTKKYCIYLTVLIWSSFTAYGSEEDRTIPVIAVNSSGQSVVTQIPIPLYQSAIQNIIASVQVAVQPVLDKTSSQALTPAHGMSMHTIGVGAALSGFIGLGPIWSISATPRIRMVFTNSLSPIYPD